MSEGQPRLPDGCTLIAHDSIASTNAEAARLASEGVPAWTFVQAREQTAGRGRQGRSWTSPPGNLYVSVILRPTGSALRSSQLSLVVALALAQAIEETMPGLDGLCLKWPNDVLIGDSKVAGVLLESASSAGGADIEWVVAGTGINVRSHPSLQDRATTSLAARGLGPDVGDLLSAYARHLVDAYATWCADGFAPTREAWLRRAYQLGMPIEVGLPDTRLAGRFGGLDDEGALLLDCASGRRVVTAGEVSAGEMADAGPESG